MDIIMTGWAGLKGSAILAHMYRDSLTERLPEFIISRTEELSADIDVRAAKDTAESFGAVYCPVADGGIYKALWDISAEAKTGIEVYLSKISSRQETIEICECLDANPYMLNSEGSLVIISEKGNMIVRELHKKGIEARVIGYTCKGNGKVIINGDLRSYIQPRIKDELLRYKKP